MSYIMEEFLWVWVTRMLHPLKGVGQPHKVTAFDWTPEHWALMEQQPDAAAAAQAIDDEKKANEKEKAEQAAELLKAVRRKEDKDIGAFEL